MHDHDDAPITLLPRSEITRRDALKLFAAGVAMAELACIERPGEEIRPSVMRPEHAPGTPVFYATSMVLDGYATGLLVEAHGGRPTKIEGNPLHPSSLGATLAVHQASIIDLYDPHRMRAPRAGGLPATWSRFRTVLERLPGGELWLVLPPDASPSIATQLDRIRTRYPQTRVLRHFPLDRQNPQTGAVLAFGAPLELQLALDRADLVVSLDADFLASMPMSVRWSRDFAQRRRMVEPGQRPARLMVAEPMLTPTGSLADHRLPMRASDVPRLAVALVAALERRGVAMPGVIAGEVAAAAAMLTAEASAWVERVADAMVAARGATAVIAGERQPAAVHALAARMAHALGAVGTTTSFIEPAVDTLGGATFDDLAAAVATRQVGAIFALDTDPVYDAPGFARLLDEVPLSVHASMYATETSTACTWHVPLSHYLEHWGDGRAYDGTASPIQPLIRPLHDTRSTLEILALLAGTETPRDRALVRTTWRELAPDDASWHRILADGIVPGTAAPTRTVAPAATDALHAALVASLGGAAPGTGMEIDLALSPSILDGRFAHNAWLQELPHPLTKLTWGNAAYLSASTARALDVRDGDVVAIRAGSQSIEIPAMIAPGHVDAAITIELGYGRNTPLAPIANQIGVHAGLLANGGAIVPAAEVTRTGATVELARTQEVFDQQHRELALHADLRGYHAHPDFTEHHRGPLPTLLDAREHSADIPQWAMTIDTTICTGCSSCVVACQAENNIPSVGPIEVRRGREMHWLRIDTYVADGERGPEVVHQPMLCQHCEHAPCEYVCPVFATSHSPDGLNEMTYNRCVGTRFCSNNCPYKVRRFNYFGYGKDESLRALQKNPDVTVRGRGVMEKCTFCVQRIRGAEIQARMDKRAIRPGEVVTACQQACPTGAIQFGALQHTELPAAAWRALPRVYGALHELGTRPRVMYLAKITDPGENA